MTDPKDAYWDELGIAWQAIDPKLEAYVPHLRSRLQRQTSWATALMLIGIPLGVAGVILGVLTASAGLRFGWLNFVTRGIAIIVVSLLLAFSGWSQRVGAIAAASSVSDMIELTIARTKKARRAIFAGYCACTIAAIFGLVGNSIRAHSGRPTAMSPAIPLLLLALCTLGLAVYHWRLSRDLPKLYYLRNLLTTDASRAEMQVARHSIGFHT